MSGEFGENDSVDYLVQVTQLEIPPPTLQSS